MSGGTDVMVFKIGWRQENSPIAMPAKRIFLTISFSMIFLCSKNIQTSGRLCTWGKSPAQDIYKMFQELCNIPLAPMSSAELVILGKTSVNTKESANRQHLDARELVQYLLGRAAFTVEAC